MIQTIATKEMLETQAARQESALVGSYRQTYREIADQHVVETDAIEQLKANMAQLEDLHGRLRFMMAEVSYLLKKN